MNDDWMSDGDSLWMAPPPPPRVIKKDEFEEQGGAFGHWLNWLASGKRSRTEARLVLPANLRNLWDDLDRAATEREALERAERGEV